MICRITKYDKFEETIFYTHSPRNSSELRTVQIITCYLRMKGIFQEAKIMINSYDLLRKQDPFPLLPSIQKLSSLIHSDSIIRMNLELAIQNSPETLKGTSIQDLLQMLNAGVHEPPAFTLYPLVGSPVGSVFAELIQTQNGRNIFANQSFNSALKEILGDYNKMLRSQASLKYLNEKSPDGWMSQQAKQHIDYGQFMCDQSKPHYGFRSWNHFFTRSFREGTRPVYEENCKNSHQFIINACEAFPIENPIMPVINIKKEDKFWLKNQNYSLKDIFGASKIQSQSYSHIFEGGTIFQGFLDAFYYHRWHAPVEGYIEANYLIPGHYFVDRSQFTPKELDSFKISQSFLASIATRRVIVIDTKNPVLGRVGLVFIGMADISSCLSDLQRGEEVKKGQYLGHFEIGGSSYAMIFEKRAQLNFTPNLYDESRKGRLQRVNSFLAELL